MAGVSPTGVEGTNSALTQRRLSKTSVVREPVGDNSHEEDWKSSLNALVDQEEDLGKYKLRRSSRSNARRSSSGNASPLFSDGKSSSLAHTPSPPQQKKGSSFSKPAHPSPQDVGMPQFMDLGDDAEEAVELEAKEQSGGAKTNSLASNASGSASRSGNNGKPRIIPIHTSPGNSADKVDTMVKLSPSGFTLRTARQQPQPTSSSAGGNHLPRLAPDAFHSPHGDAPRLRVPSGSMPKPKQGGKRPAFKISSFGLQLSKDLVISTQHPNGPALNLGPEAYQDRHDGSSTGGASATVDPLDGTTGSLISTDTLLSVE